ncbi:MAG: hypothetical protein GY869_24940 [Planctomycetes bacterium]|nr:hypothetical protein [Planctomycetota bacterium]
MMEMQLVKQPPMVLVAGECYCVDLDIKQFWAVNNPFDCVEFDSPKGRKWCRMFGIITCPRCSKAYRVKEEFNCHICG